MNAEPTARKIVGLFIVVVDLNNSIPPVRPRNNVAVPPITKLYAESALAVISGKKTPASNAKIATK